MNLAGDAVHEMVDGALLTLAAGAWLHALVVRVLVPLAARGFVCIAAANLIPELHHGRRRSAVVE